MSTGFFKVPTPINEPVKSYSPGSAERKEVLDTYKKMIKENIEIPMYINGKDVKSNKTNSVSPPHDHKNIVAKYYLLSCSCNGIFIYTFFNYIILSTISACIYFFTKCHKKSFLF